MRFPSVSCCWFLLLSASLVAQTHGGGNRGPGTAFPGSTAPQPSATPGLNPGVGAAFITGKVVLEDGGELTDTAAIEMTCHGQRHTTAYTDRRGNFSFQFADANSTAVADAGDASTTMMTRTTSMQEQRNWRDCEVQAALAGFTSQSIELASRMSTLESVDLGRISLHRMEQVEGTSISVTTALAPNAAKKAFEKAREDEKKGKSDQAEQSLQKAVQLYPKFAVAWNELGKLQVQKKDFAGAKISFEQSVAADSKYVNPYDGLAMLAFQASEWQEVVDTTNKLLSLNPVNFPNAYFYNGAANYSLGNIDVAEKMTRQGIRIDDGHQIPKLQYLLGIILMRKQQYQEASEQLQQFMKFAKQPAEVDEAKKQLSEIERRSASAAATPANERK